ncbi:MAG: toprim domain-containing protein [Deltaproteobacteria bacterium]|nr:toprim domain-containing protein [Deltaproteobacteria bacterium]
MAYRYDYQELRDQAQGRWSHILASLAPELECALEKAPRHVPCPVHGGKDGFRLYRDYEDNGGAVCNTCGPQPNGFRLLQWLRGWSFPQALEAVSEALGGGVPLVHLQESGNGKSPAAKVDDDCLRAILNRMWAETLPLIAPQAEPARAYLQGRGITILPPSGLRYHPSLAYYEEGREQGKYPGLLAKLTDGQDRAITLHRIYLTPDGRKAQVKAPKKTMPYPSDRKLTGSAVRLGPAAPILGVAEGIETALAVTRSTDMVCWATTSAALLEMVVLPALVKRVVVWGDHDRKKAGQKAALRLAARLVKEGKRVRVRLAPAPPSDRKSWDWADVLAGEGPGGFPQPW